MKKLLIFFIVFLTMTVMASFAEVMPKYSYQIKHPGIGLYNIPNEVTIYSNPDENSKVIRKIKWDENGLENKQEKENDVFIYFRPKQKFAVCSVDEEIDGWVKIFYSQSTGKSGWIKANPLLRYLSWRGFFMYYGRKNGIFLFRDMPAINKRLMSAPSADSQKITEFVYPKFIKVSLVRGNWMMVKMVDFGNEAKVGWLQWRTETGKIMVFPNSSKP